MVKAGDMVAIPGRQGTVSSADAAALLGIGPPAPDAGADNPAPPPMTRVIITSESRTGRSHFGVLVSLLAFVALVAVVYFAVLRQAPGPAPESAPFEVRFAPASAPAGSAIEMEAPATPVDSWPDASPTAAAAPVAGPAGAKPAMPTAAAPPAPAASADSLATTAPPQSAADGWWTKAHELMSAQNWSGLDAHARKWTESEPRRGLAWYYLGQARLYLLDYPGAIAALQEANRLAPDLFEARQSLAVSYNYAKRFQEGAAILNQLVRERPGMASLWTNLGISLSNLGEIDDSIAAFQKVVQLEPNNREGWRALGQTYAHFGYMDKANAAMDKANGR
jgi:Flp pilus assembly protein TadD